jgi:hypothetical protein
MPASAVRTAILLAGLAALAALAACGGSDKKGGAAKPAVRAPGTRLALVEGKVTWTAPGATMAVGLKSDGVFDVVATYREKADGPEETKRRSGKMTPAGELHIDGKVVARLADNGTLSVLHEREVFESGQLVKSDSSWEEVGALDDKGVFTARDGRRLSVGADGKLAGIPSGMTITVDVGGTPEGNRTALFLIIASFSASKETTSSEGPGKDAAPPQPPDASTAPPAPPP